MLKIKDKVDLKELEKFGFIEVKLLNKKAYKKEQVYIALWYGQKRQIYLGDTSKKDLDILFDLIQAGLVKKVEQPNGEQSK